MFIKIFIYAATLSLVTGCVTPKQLAEQKAHRQRVIAAMKVDLTKTKPTDPDATAVKYVTEHIQPNLKDHMRQLKPSSS